MRFTKTALILFVVSLLPSCCRKNPFEPKYIVLRPTLERPYTYVEVQILRQKISEITFPCSKQGFIDFTGFDMQRVSFYGWRQTVGYSRYFLNHDYYIVFTHELGFSGPNRELPSYTKPIFTNAEIHGIE
jgi:hypothetical protein